MTFNPPALTGHEQQMGLAITVIIATHDGARRIRRALDSLAAQTLELDRFEVVVVVNGDDHDTAPLVREWAEKVEPLSVRLLRSTVASASHARNLGIGAARGAYCTFLDDDDWLSPTYLADLLALAEPGVVVVSRINDVVGHVNALPRTRNYFNNQVVKWAGLTASFAEIPTAAAANAGKLVETERAASVAFDVALRSGEDVVFWSELMTRDDVVFRFVDLGTHAVYYRWIRDESISRRHASLGFSVLERLDVIERVLPLRSSRPQYAAALESMARAQALRINEYLLANPDAREEVLGEIRARNLVDFPYSTVNRGLARELVIAYAFPPTNDTSGIVIARRIAKRGQPVDVVSSRLEKLRVADPSTTLIAREHIAQHVVIDRPATFGGWRLIEEFCVTALARLESIGSTYERLYSRSMWPAAHILGALYKARNPDVVWSAEFSDPILYDSQGNRRAGRIAPGPVLDELREVLESRGVSAPEGENLFEWIEHLAYVLADEITFTNANQLEYMLGYLSDPDLAAHVRRKASIDPHPTLPRDAYTLVESATQFDPSKINIGYFGVFYKVRGVGEILEALSRLSADMRGRFAVHIFTDKPSDTADAVAQRGMSDLVFVNSYVNYLEFLNLTTKLDWLLVCDARTSASHGINPYLPSKLSDYKGSGTPIWAIVEEGSVLSGTEVHAKSVLGDVDGASQVLESMGRLNRAR